MYLQYVKQVGAAIREALAKVAGKLFFSRGTLPLKAKPIAKINEEFCESFSLSQLDHTDHPVKSPLRSPLSAKTGGLLG